MWFFSFLNWWNSTENYEKTRDAKKELSYLIATYDTKFKNLLIDYEDDKETLKKIKQLYNHFLMIKWKLEEWKYQKIYWEWVSETLSSIISQIKNQFEYFLDKYEKNFFERPENMSLWEKLLDLCDEAWMRWKNWETDFAHEKRAFKKAEESLSEYKTFINFMCRDKWFDYTSQEVQHLVSCLKKWNELIKTYRSFFSEEDWDLEKAIKIIDNLTAISYELYDEWFYEDLLDEYEGIYWRLTSEWPEHLNVDLSTYETKVNVPMNKSWRYEPSTWYELYDLIQNKNTDPWKIDVKHITDFSKIFELKVVPSSIKAWNMSNAKIIDWMFYNATFQDPYIDLSHLNLKNVESARNCFQWSNFDWNCNFHLWENVSECDIDCIFIESQFTWINAENLSNWNRFQMINYESIYYWCNLDSDFERYTHVYDDSEYE